MLLAKLNNTGTQIGSLASLAQLIAKNDLEGQLQSFLLSCRSAGLAYRTIEDYSEKIGFFVSFCLRIGVSRAEEVNETHVELFLVDRQQRCKPTSVKDYYGCINRLFNWMVEKHRLVKNPMDDMRPPRVPRVLIQPFKPEQISCLLELCDNSFLGLRNRAIILTLLDSGLRLSELAGVQLGDVDMDRGIIKVMGKGAKERMVGIAQETQKAILTYFARRDCNLPCLWVTEERKPLTGRGIATMIERLGERAELANVRCSPHTFRHTFGTMALKLGADIREVQSLLGHSTLTMTLKYVATVNSEQAVSKHRQFSPVENLKL